MNILNDSVLVDLNRQGIKATLVETGEVATEMQTADDIASMKMLEAADVADAIVYALTRPEHVRIKDVQLLAPKTA